MNGDGLCASCFSGLRWLVNPYCVRCAQPFAYDIDPYPHKKPKRRLCDSCREDPPLYENVRAPLVYNGTASKIFTRFKHGGKTELVPFITRIVASASRDLFPPSEEVDKPILVPVPLHKRRVFKRGYNQSGLLARALGKRYETCVYFDVLKRVKYTPSLGKLNGRERRAILKNSIEANTAYSAELNGKRVILVDDVMTSGATAGICAEKLLELGCCSVDVIVGARAVAYNRASTVRESENEENNMSKVVIYTQPGCPFCIRAIDLLKRNDIAFQEINAPKGTPERDESIRLSGKTSVPQIFVDGESVGGCDSLIDIIDQGRLDSVFKR